MKHLLIIFILLITSCHEETKYPDGGFDYPGNLTASDTNYYYYQLKDLESKSEAFEDRYAYLFYKPFEEPNLSIKPFPKETFRLTYSTSNGKSVLVILTDNQVIVKKGRPSTLYTLDTMQLSNIEKFHLNLLQRRFPIETNTKNFALNRYLDSLVKLYPQLLDPAYYYKIYEKALIRNTEKFTYSTIKTEITKQQYNSIIQQINTSGFWSMPYNVDCEYPARHSGGFTFEANTRMKYKVVSVTECPDDRTKFTKACQKLLELAKVDNEVRLIWGGGVDSSHADK